MPRDGLDVEMPFYRRGGPAKTRVAEEPEPAPAMRPLHVAQMLALAYEMAQLIGTGVVADRAEMARVTGFCDSRVSQIMEFLWLAPDIQEALLVTEIAGGRDGMIAKEAHADRAVPVVGRAAATIRSAREVAIRRCDTPSRIRGSTARGPRGKAGCRAFANRWKAELFRTESTDCVRLKPTLIEYCCPLQRPIAWTVHASLCPGAPTRNDCDYRALGLG